MVQQVLNGNRTGCDTRDLKSVKLGGVWWWDKACTFIVIDEKDCLHEDILRRGVILYYKDTIRVRPISIRKRKHISQFRNQILTSNQSQEFTQIKIVPAQFRLDTQRVGPIQTNMLVSVIVDSRAVVETPCNGMRQFFLPIRIIRFSVQFIT